MSNVFFIGIALRGADRQWRSLPKAEAPTEAVAETRLTEPRYIIRLRRAFENPTNQSLKTKNAPEGNDGSSRCVVFN